MTTLGQIFWGGSLLGFSTLLHVAIVAFTIPGIQAVAQLVALRNRPNLRIAVILLTTVFGLLFGHLAQIWCWALVFRWLDLFGGIGESFYFATVTYTTLGYGDIVLGAAARIFATFAAIAGLFTFGISTAFLLGLIARILPDVFSDGA